MPFDHAFVESMGVVYVSRRKSESEHVEHARSRPALVEHGNFQEQRLILGFAFVVYCKT
jgi:hypothetical protein